MARISTYNIDQIVTAQDKWIGTDSNGSITKNFSAQNVANFLNQASAIAIAGQNNFFFQTDLSNGRSDGSISFTNGGGANTAFTALTTIKISKYSTSGNIVLNYLQTLVNQAVFIAQTDNVNNFGIYKLLSLIQDVLEPNFYDATFQLINGNSGLLVNKFYAFSVYPGFISGPFTPSTITLTTTGTGAATLVSNVLNIPTPNLTGFVPYTGATTTVNLGSQSLIAGGISVGTTVSNAKVYIVGSSGYGGLGFATNTLNHGLAFISTVAMDTSIAPYEGDMVFSAAYWNGTIYSFPERFRIAGHTGNIGIDVTAPTQKLHVNGNARITGAIYDSANSPGTSGQVLSSTATGTSWINSVPAGVTSVGLSMPTAFTVTNSPITGAGTIAVAGAGLTSQYVRGDGTLATFPTSTGGGSSINYYLNGSISQGTFGGDTYYQMSRTPILGAGTNFTRTNGAGNGYIASFITDAGDPNQLNIPGGNWNVEFWFNASSGGGTPSFYAELYKVDATNVFTLIASDSLNPEGITNGTAIDQYFTSIPVPQTALLTTDRLAVRIFVNTSGKTITLHTENGNLSEVLTTFSSGLTALNGLTSQVQYFAVGTSGTNFNISSVTDTHTFNLPTASAVNRGALSSADWTAFNSKFNLPSLTNGSVLFSNGTTIAQDNTNFFWDDTNNRLGIGTATPTRTLDVVGLARISGQIETQKITNLSTVSNVPADASLLLYAPTTTNNYGGIIGWAESNIAASISSYDDGSGGALGLALSTGNATSISEKMRITSTGNVGIGDTIPSDKLVVNGRARINGTNALAFGNNAGGYAQIAVSGATTGNLLFSTYDGAALGERMRITTTGNIGIGTSGPAASAKLDVFSTTQGFLPPRMTTTERNAIATPATGLIVYDNTLLSLYQFNGTAWVAVGAGGGSTKSINSISTNTAAGSLASTDYFYFASGTINITLPTAVGNNNNYVIKNVGTGTITIDTTSSQTIDGSLTAPIKVQYLSLTLISDGANWNII